MKTSEPDMVQYYIVNEELSMSAGKIAAQVAHAATTLTLHTIFNEKEKANQESFQAWLNTGQKKIVLRGTEADLLQLVNHGFMSIRDAGHTEIPSGSLTVVVLPPMKKSEARKNVEGLKLL